MPDDEKIAVAIDPARPDLGNQQLSPREAVEHYAEYINRLLDERAPKHLGPCMGCGAAPGHGHQRGCDIERCSVCGGQRLQCDALNEHAEHDPAFARWTGIWPGSAEAAWLGISLNEIYKRGLHQQFFVKPCGKET